MSDATAAVPAGPKPLGLRLITLYKFLKGPAVLVLAGWLTFAPDRVLHATHAVEAGMLEWGVLFHRVAVWLRLHVTSAAVHGGAVFAWLDGATTLLEGVLLWLDYAWGEWLVVASVSALVPVELWSLAHHPRAGTLGVLAANVAIAAYLVRRRLAHAARCPPAHHPHAHRAEGGG